MKHTPKLIATLLLLLLTSLHAQVGNDAFLAIVGDKVITLFEVVQNTFMDEQKLRNEYVGRELENKIADLRRRTLDYLIERELCYKEFKALKAQVPTDYLQNRLNEIIEERANGNIALFEEALHKQNMTMKEFKDQLEKDLAIYMLVTDRRTRGNTISDNQVIAYYEKEKDSMATPSSYHLAVIQLRKAGKYAGKLDETVAEIIGQIKDGVPFEELAAKYSEGSNAEKGGDMDWMEKPHPTLLETVNKLQPGQICTKPVELGSSLFLVKLIDLKKGGVPDLTPELLEKLRSKLTKEEEDRRYKELIRELYMKYPVTRMDGTK